MNSESVIMIGLQNHQQPADRPRLVSQKTREIGVKNRSCLSCAAASLNDLANRTLVF